MFSILFLLFALSWLRNVLYVLNILSVQYRYVMLRWVEFTDTSSVIWSFVISTFWES